MEEVKGKMVAKNQKMIAQRFWQKQAKMRDFKLYQRHVKHLNLKHFTFKHGKE